MKRARGGALLYVLTMLLAVSAVVIAAINVGAAGYTAQIRAERKAMSHAAFDGAVDQIAADCAAGTLVVPSTRQVKIGSVDCSMTITDNNASVPGSYAVSGSMAVKGLTYGEKRIIARGGTPNPFYYVLFSNSTLNTAQAVVTNGPSWAGDMAVNGNIVLSNASSQVNGDAEATGTIGPGSLNVTGTKLQGADPVPFPVLPFFLLPALNPYLIEAVLQLPGLLINGLNLGSGYSLAYALLATQIKGTFTGKGTIYFPGNVTIVGDIAYGDSQSRLAVIAYGNITVQSGVTHLAGHYYAGGTFTVQGPNPKTLDSGSIVANAFSIGAAINLNHDAAIWKDPTEGYRLKLPGYWP